MPLPEPKHALVRDPSPRYAAFYAQRGIHISDALARAQHDRYRAALELAGLEVTTLPAHPQLHDCVFIEDTAIVWEHRALITRMTPLREGEQLEVQDWLATHGFDLVHPPLDVRIEGGDVMHLDDVTCVGLTGRTNRAGIDALAAMLRPFNRPVVAIPVGRCLHLKSAMTYLGNKTVLISSNLVDVELPDGYRRLEVPAAEAHAGNALRVNNRILLAAGFERTAALVQKFCEEHGCTLTELEISELQKGDGAITCSSIVW
jgi:dimethylargininase